MPNRSRVAYLIISHALPDQLVRLTSLLRRGSADSSIVVHHDDRKCSVDRASLGTIGVKLIEPPSHVGWGEASHLIAILRCFRWLLDRVDFDWLVLLSGQDYPIRPVSEIERSLVGADVDAFIETRPCERPELRSTIDDFAGRYHYRWWRIPRERTSPLALAVAKLRPLVRARTLPNGTWIGVPVLRSPFGSALRCHSGSDWFTLSSAAVDAVDQFVKARPDVLRYYRRTLIPTESFIQTVLANDCKLRLSGDYRRYLVFDAEDPTGPRVLGIGDLDSILASGGDFARKFDHTVAMRFSTR